MFELQSCGVQISRDVVVIITKKAVIFIVRCIAYIDIYGLYIFMY